MFKVTLVVRPDFVEHKRSTRHTSYLNVMSEKYKFQFHQLDLTKFEAAHLSEYEIYLLVSPIMLYLWLGDEVEDDVRAGQLNLIDAFFQIKNLDLFQSQPSYKTKKKFSETMKIRLEQQGYESPLFMSHLGLASEMPSTDDVGNFTMLRRLKHAYYLNEKQLEAQN